MRFIARFLLVVTIERFERRCSSVPNSSSPTHLLTTSCSLDADRIGRSVEDVVFDRRLDNTNFGEVPQSSPMLSFQNRDLVHRRFKLLDK
jgi:hypothetical protein